VSLVSLECFQSTLSTLVADPELIVRARNNDLAWLNDPDLENHERDRLIAMASDDRIEVLCSLYRSNRLTALVRSVPSLVEALGAELDPVVSAFWRSTRTTLQPRSEGEAFCRYVMKSVDDADLIGTATMALDSLRHSYGF
jgi:hypothetical protein